MFLDCEVIHIMRKMYLALAMAVVLLFCYSCSSGALQNLGRDLEDSLSGISDTSNSAAFESGEEQEAKADKPLPQLLTGDQTMSDPSGSSASSESSDPTGSAGSSDLNGSTGSAGSSDPNGSSLRPEDMYASVIGGLSRDDGEYAFYDIDGDGIAELFTLNKTSAEEYTIIYSYVDGVVHELAGFWSRYFIASINADGTIYTCGSSGAAYHTIEALRVSDDKKSLVIVEVWEAEYDSNVFSHTARGATSNITEREYGAVFDAILDDEGVLADLELSSLSPCSGGGVPQNAHPVEILYDGEPIVNWLGSRLSDLRMGFGEPNYKGVVWEGGTLGCSYDGITFNKSEYGDDIEYIWGEPAAITFNGTALDLNRGGLVGLFGPTDYEGWYESFGYEAYAIHFTVQEVYTISFSTEDPSSPAFEFWVYKRIPSTMSFRDYTMPPDQYVGDIFGVRGVIESSYQILSVHVGVTSVSGVVEISSVANPNANRYDIRNLDYDLLFDRLTPGLKVYFIEATNEMESFRWEFMFMVN